MRVLLLAFECNPEWYSLPAVAYNYAKILAQYVDELVVVTQTQNKENIEKYGGIKGAKVVFLDVDRIVRPFENAAFFLMGGHRKNVGWTIYRTLMYPSYLYFEWVVWQHFKSELKNGDFDIIHRLTPMTPTLPSPIAQWSSVPFVLGPLNGGLRWPKQFGDEQNREREWLSNFRNVYKLLPYQQSSYKHADVILAAFDHTINDLPASSQAKVVNFPEVGIDTSLFSLPKRDLNQKLKILYVGRLVPYKMPEVVIRAFAKSAVLQEHELLMVGDGAEKSRLQSIVDSESLGHCVKLLGQVSHEEVGRLMCESDIFAFPSIRELGAGAVIEAMACGLACVVVDYGGCGGLVDHDRGVKVPMGSKDDLVLHFANELEKLVQNPQRVRDLGEKAYEHAVSHYSWDAKARKNVEIYNWALNKNSRKPNFWNINSSDLNPEFEDDMLPVEFTN